MRNEPFRHPVTLYLRQDDGQVRPTPLTSTEELMHSHDFALANPNWQIALDAVVRALLDPKPERVEASRRALERLTFDRSARTDPPTLH
jgi:hypothetical protein